MRWTRCRFTGLVAKGRQAAALEEWPSARVFLREGLSLWRGNAYAEFADSEFAQAEATTVGAAQSRCVGDEFSD